MTFLPWIISSFVIFALLEIILYFRRSKKARLAESLLMHAKEEMQEIAQLPLNNPYPVIQITESGHIIFANKACIELFPDIEQLGFDHPTLQAVKSLTEEHTEQPIKHEVSYAGKSYDQAIAKTSIKNEPAYMVYFYDMTFRKTFENELKRAQQRSEQSRIEAEKAKEARGEFLANMSHELRTPMNGIIGLSDILSETGLKDDQQEMIEAVNSSARNLLILLNDILDFSKIEAGELTMEHIPFDIRKVVGQIESLQRPVASQKGLTLKSKCSDLVPRRLIGDPSRLQQILNNLISNALKFTKDGSVTISIDGQADEHNNFTTQIAVTDTGIGIPKDKQAAVFEKFQQADASTAREYGGTGLGLAITKDLAELMNGGIAIQSEEGVGTTFTVTITAPIAEIDEEERCDDNHQDGGIHLNASVLVVDDNPINLLFMRKTLTKFGFTDFDEATSGKEAIALFRDKPYALILMDCQMPEMDGFEASTQIRASQGINNKPVIIAVTADAMKGAEDKCIAAGMDDYISKPVDKNKLKMLLQKWVPGEDKIQNTTHAEIKDDETLSVLNLERLDDFTDGCAEAELQLLTIFIESLETDIKGLQESFNSHDFERWDSFAHKLYGGSAHIGATAMAEICDQAQCLGDHNDEDKIKAIHSKILEQYRHLDAALKKRTQAAA